MQYVVFQKVYFRYLILPAETDMHDIEFGTINFKLNGKPYRPDRPAKVGIHLYTV